jgi:tripartite-type tricarboxylate transporter receptor subunit TctC
MQFDELKRREFVTLLAGILALASGGRSAAIAQGYPAAPVKLIVTTGAGGAPDVIARIVAEGLSRRWGQQVFVANHPGAAGSIGMKVAGAASPDGYTLLFALSSSFVALPEIAKDYPYDLVRDFVSIGFVCEQPMAIAVQPSLGIETLDELIEYVKKRPGQVNVADIGDYSMISSAAAENAICTSIPIALAVLRLRTNSNLAACITGSSPGFSPLRTRAT